MPQWRKHSRVSKRTVISLQSDLFRRVNDIFPAVFHANVKHFGFFSTINIYLNSINII